jgi:hypothetical protein
MSENFDVCQHQIKKIIIDCGKLLWPDEKNVTVLYEKTCDALKVPRVRVTSAHATHLPTPEESVKADQELARECPKCGKKAFFVYSICQTCKQSENGKYKTLLACYECRTSERSEDPLVVWLDRLGIDYGTQSKASLGIKTLTDDGLE